MTDCIKMIMGSDFHFGTLGIPSYEMADAFRKTVFPLIEKGVDLFCINGDFFDRAVSFEAGSFDPIYVIMIDILTMCQRHDVKLRVLQGTWSHDRSQCKKFEVFYKTNGYDFDFKFIDCIDFEEISFSGGRSLRFLYIPDDIGPRSSEDILEIVHTKRQERGWDKVDYVCMHGFFDFTFPKNVSTKGVVVYREDQFGFVKKGINVGHVHQYRVGPDSLAISNGSFDRICHGDEDPKGLILYTDKEESYTAQFIENKNSAVFNSIKFKEDDDTDHLRVTIENHIKSLKTDREIHLRFFIGTPEQQSAIRTWMKEQYPNVHVSTVYLSDVKLNSARTIDVESFMEDEEGYIVPNRSNLASFIRDTIPDNYDISIERIQERLDAPN